MDNNLAKQVPRVTCVILSRNRFEYLADAIRSAVRQTCPFERIIVSDSSSNIDESDHSSLKSLVEGATGSVSVDLKIRSPENSFSENWIQSLNGTGTPWVVFFHDDDTLEPEYVETLVSLMGRHPDCSVFGVGASVIDDKSKRVGSFCRADMDRVINGPREVIESYYCSIFSRPAPFPGYCYSTKLLKEVEMPRIGRLSDVAFLMCLATKSKIVWSCREVMNYRIHSLQDTRSISVSDFSSLFEWMLDDRVMEPRAVMMLKKLAMSRAETRALNIRSTIQYFFWLFCYRTLR